MQVSVSVTVEVPATASFEEIERACLGAARASGCQAIGKLLELKEERRRGRRRHKGRGRTRTVLSLCGYVTYCRGRGRRADGTRYFPPDEALGLSPHHEASPAVRRRGTELAACYPYRQAAELLAAEVGTRV